MAVRLQQHFQNSGDNKTFAGRYYCYKLIYFECYPSAEQAIEREKQLKGWTRSKKEALIKSKNPKMKFLNYIADKTEI
ncbi:GIY-YIG nuclease family protein [Adhaeribacter terreus]|uniref:GIY-YIG nuclease family protein n=1 Tax=Adhaeribacter terreus TaxID=529703 RepID=A0ABW0EAM9_9BACT